MLVKVIWNGENKVPDFTLLKSTTLLNDFPKNKKIRRSLGREIQSRPQSNFGRDKYWKSNEAWYL